MRRNKAVATLLTSEEPDGEEGRFQHQPGDRFAEGLGIRGIVLVSLDVWLHIGRRHQIHYVSNRLEFA